MKTDLRKLCKFAHKNSFQLLIFLNSCNGDIDLTAAKLEKYYELKRATPEFFSNRDISSDEIQHCLNSLYYVTLPITPDNCNLILHKLRSLNPKDYMFDGAVKTFIMKSEVCAYNNGPRSGTIFIDDLEGASIWHLFRPSIGSVRKGLRFLQDGSPLNVKAIHVLNTVPFLDKIIAIVKPFLRSEMFNKIHFHPSNMDYEKFYQEWIPKSCLPSDYGGDLESIENLHNQQRETFLLMRDYFLMEEGQMNFEYDKCADDYESKRKN